MRVFCIKAICYCPPHEFTYMMQIFFFQEAEEEVHKDKGVPCSVVCTRTPFLEFGKKCPKKSILPHWRIIDLMTFVFIERVSQIFTQTKGQPNFLGEDKGGLPHHF